MHNDDDGNRDADDDQTVVSGSDNRVVLRETTKGLAIARPMSMSHRSAFAPTIVDRLASYRTERAPDRPEPLSRRFFRLRLFQLRRNAGEAGVQLGADTVDNGDNRNGDASGDQAILDSRGARLVLHKTRNEGLHDEMAP